MANKWVYLFTEGNANMAVGSYPTVTPQSPDSYPTVTPQVGKVLSALPM